MLSQVPVFGALWTVAHQAPLSTEFPRQEYWSGLPFPPPFRTQESNQASCISYTSRQILYPCATWEAVFLTNWLYIGGSRVINLLERFTELRETFIYMYQFITKDIIKRTDR